jgi:hypothetical protein
VRIRFPSDRTLLHGQFFFSLLIVRDAMLGQALSKTTFGEVEKEGGMEML